MKTQSPFLNISQVIKTLGLAALLGLAATIFAIAPLNGGAWAADSIGTVSKQRADAYGTPPNGSRERKFPRYDVVFGELIETSGGAAILIKMNDDTELFLGERASITIDDFVYEPGGKTGHAVYKFTVGTLRFVSGAMHGNGVTIETPNAYIGIRGSEAVIFVTLEGQTTVNVIKGTFSVGSRDRPDAPAIDVKANQNVTLSGVATFSPVETGIKVPDYSHAPPDSGTFDKDSGGKGPDFSEDLKDIRSGGGFDKAREGKVTGGRGHDDQGHDTSDHGHH